MLNTVAVGLGLLKPWQGRGRARAAGLYPQGALGQDHPEFPMPQPLGVIHTIILLKTASLGGQVRAFSRTQYLHFPLHDTEASPWFRVFLSSWRILLLQFFFLISYHKNPRITSVHPGRFFFLNPLVDFNETTSAWKRPSIAGSQLSEAPALEAEGEETQRRGKPIVLETGTAKNKLSRKLMWPSLRFQKTSS